MIDPSMMPMPGMANPMTMLDPTHPRGEQMKQMMMILGGLGPTVPMQPRPQYDRPPPLGQGNPMPMAGGNPMAPGLPTPGVQPQQSPFNTPMIGGIPRRF